VALLGTARFLLASPDSRRHELRASARVAKCFRIAAEPAMHAVSRCRCLQAHATVVDFRLTCSDPVPVNISLALALCADHRLDRENARIPVDNPAIPPRADHGPRGHDPRILAVTCGDRSARAVNALTCPDRVRVYAVLGTAASPPGLACAVVCIAWA